MYTEINSRMEEAQQGVFRLRKIDSMLKTLREEQLSLECKVSGLKDILDKEDNDVKNLEKQSLASIFYSVIGKLDEHLEKEQGEALAAKLKYDLAVRDLEDVKNEITKLCTERVSFADSGSRYESLYTKKRGMLIESEPDRAQNLLNLNEQLNVSRNALKEIKEAISAGRNVISSLESAMGSLESAEGWGIWDMLGGGLVSDLVKHSHIDNARYDAERAQGLLRRFKTELSDIKIKDDIHFETDGFAKFADFFFDGLIADWFMQSRIQNSHESVSQFRGQVQEVLSRLGSLERQESSRIKKIDSEIKDLIIKA